MPLITKIDQPLEDQGKSMMVLEVRVGIPVSGYNALGQARLIERYVSDLRELGVECRATTVLDRVELV